MILLALALAVVALGLVVYPLLRRGISRETVEEPGGRLSELYSRRGLVYSAIKELEFERDLGSLSPRDYQALEARYKGRAIAILKEIDEASSGEGWQRQIEDEVARRRQARKAGAASCPRCGASLRPGSRFCPQCGSPLSAACPHCGTAFREGERFCSRCGASLTSGGGG